MKLTSTDVANTIYLGLVIEYHGHFTNLAPTSKIIFLRLCTVKILQDYMTLGLYMIYVCACVCVCVCMCVCVCVCMCVDWP